MGVSNDLEDDFGFRQLSTPLTRRMLRPPTPGLRTVQFETELTPKDYAKLGKWMRKYPDIELRSYGDVRDLEFLRHFPDLRGLSVGGTSLESLDGLGYLSSQLTRLTLDGTLKRFSLQPIKHLTGLAELYLDGHVTDINVIAELENLRRLTLHSITLPNLDVLKSLEQLSVLSLELGGTRDLNALTEMPQLRVLDVSMVRGMSDLDAVSAMVNLEAFALCGMRQVTSLPDLSKMTNLRGVTLEATKGLSDLSPLSAAPLLERVYLINMTHLEPDDVAVLQRSSSLRYVHLGLGSDKKNIRARELVGLPEPPDL